MARSSRLTVLLALLIAACGSEDAYIPVSSNVRAAKQAIASIPVDITILKNSVPLSHVDVAFSRSISGREANYRWTTRTNVGGDALITISSGGEDIAGYYSARAIDPESGRILEEWDSIPINPRHRDAIILAIGENARRHTIRFEDSVVEAYIRLSISKPVGPLSEDDLAGISSLLLPDSNVEHLGGLEHLSGLHTVDLSGNRITRLDAIRNLTISKLDLSRNQICDVSPLASMHSLSWLYLSHNRIEDISSLSKLEVGTLDVSHNSLTSLPKFSQDLHYFIGSHNQIGTYVDTVAFWELHLSNNGLQTFNVRLPEVRELDLSDNEISELTLDVPSSLRRLFYQNNPTQDISSIGNRLPFLEILDISGCGLGDLSFFDRNRMVAMRRLYLNNNQITDLTTLRQAVPWALRTIELDDNRISDLAPLLEIEVNIASWLSFRRNPLSQQAIQQQIPILQEKWRDVYF